jgi:pyruvate,water dikinase
VRNPNNVILGEEFGELFDGFSIGSNDLVQLALGVDRDSELLAHIFDERDPWGQRLIRMIVEAAYRKARKVGICEPAPSDYPEFAEFLAGIGIDSISLNLDSLAEVTQPLAAPVKQLLPSSMTSTGPAGATPLDGVGEGVVAAGDG